MKNYLLIISILLNTNLLLGQNELSKFTKSQNVVETLNKKELREYVSFLEIISDSLLLNKSETIVELQSQLDVRNKRIISIENEIGRLKTLQSKLESEKSKLESEKSELETEKSELENKLEKLSILVSKNNEELNLLRKLNGIEKDTIQKNHDIEETSDGRVLSVGELTLTPKGYIYRNNPYSGYLWNLKEGNYIFNCHQSTEENDLGGNRNDLYFGMIRDGVKDGIWVENKNGWTNTLKITKYEKGKINNGFTLEIDWDLSYYLIQEELKLKNFFDSLPDEFQYIEITENVDEQTDNITYDFRYEGNKTFIRNRQLDKFYKSLNSKEKTEFTKDLYKILCLKLNQVENPMDLLILLNGYITFKIDTYTSGIKSNKHSTNEVISIKIDNYKLGFKNGISINSKLKPEELNIPGSNPDYSSSEDVNRKERWTYSWDIDFSNYKNGELDSNSIKGKYNYIKDGTNRGVITYPQFVDKKRYWTPIREGDTKNLLKYLRNGRSGVSNVIRTFEETSPNRTDITFFRSKPDFISISETDEYELENYKQGKKDGVQSYYKDGVLTRKEKYSEGELNGDKEIYTKGVIQSVETFSNGVLTSKKIYENGIIKEELSCSEEKSSYGYMEKLILKRFIYENGNLRETWFYKKDTRFSGYENEENTDKITKH